MMDVSQERDLVRELARRVIEIAHEPRMKDVRKRWCDVNELRKPDRAPVWCRPVGCWSEILPDSELQCETPEYRRLEYGFRQELFKYDVGDDTIFEPHFTVGASFDVTPANTWGVKLSHHNPDVQGGAWAYDPPLREESDLDNLAMPEFTYNRQATDERLEWMSELFGDIAPVQLHVGAPMGATFGSWVAELRGLEQMMVDMYDNPRLLHRLMAHLRDAALASMDVAEQTGLVTPNIDGPMTESEPIGEPATDGTHTLLNCWCMANSQELDQVSPPMWEEFLLDYQRPIFERFGHVGYGCCENLTHKIDAILRIPNLRIFVCSAWTDLNVVLNKVGADHCIMWRQKASAVVFSDESQVVDDLNEGMKRLQGRPYQVVLRELQTLAGNPDRLHKWAQAGIEAAAKYS
jgi:hypothetical protein